TALVISATCSGPSAAPIPNSTIVSAIRTMSVTTGISASSRLGGRGTTLLVTMSVPGPRSALLRRRPQLDGLRGLGLLLRPAPKDQLPRLGDDDDGQGHAEADAPLAEAQARRMQDRLEETELRAHHDRQGRESGRLQQRHVLEDQRPEDRAPLVRCL